MGSQQIWSLSPDAILLRGRSHVHQTTSTIQIWNMWQDNILYLFSNGACGPFGLVNIYRFKLPSQQVPGVSDALGTWRTNATTKNSCGCLLKCVFHQYVKVGCYFGNLHFFLKLVNNSNPIQLQDSNPHHIPSFVWANYNDLTVLPHWNHG
jgi:hypothetical protein